MPCGGAAAGAFGSLQKKLALSPPGAFPRNLDRKSHALPFCTRLLREYFFTARIVCSLFTFLFFASRYKYPGYFIYATFFWSCGISVIIPQLPAYFTPPFLVDLSKSKLRVTLHDLFHASRLLLAFTSTSSCSLA
jgi:hypothetical protein